MTGARQPSLEAPHGGDFPALDRWGRRIASAARDPRLIVYSLLSLLMILSWALIFTISARSALVSPTIPAWPGANLLGGLPGVDLPPLFEALVRICATPVALADAGIGVFAALVVMWFAMACAMMLPSAAPMIRTYCEIADTARAKGETVVHPIVLVVGYLSVWFLASFAFAAVQFVIGPGLAAGGAALTGIAGAATLAVAGAYQFSTLKDACLEKCRNPFATLFSRWSTHPRSILRLGAEQGVYCLGCCWALMLVMFAVGTMNVFWMALLALFTIVEKQGRSRTVQRAAGAILLVWASALIILTV